MVKCQCNLTIVGKKAKFKSGRDKIPISVSKIKMVNNCPKNHIFTDDDWKHPPEETHLHIPMSC